MRYKPRVSKELAAIPLVDQWTRQLDAERGFLVGPPAEIQIVFYLPVIEQADHENVVKRGSHTSRSE
jgi:hypothetical protein